MIDYNNMVVTIGLNNGDIDHFEVWWMTPFGMCQTLSEAKDKLTEKEIPFDVLRPLPVAVCKNGLFEPLL